MFWCNLYNNNNNNNITFFQVFSVRVRDKGPDYRGFVQLPVVQASDADVLDSEAALITQTSALCFVDTCQRSFDASILKCHVSIYFNLVSLYYIMLEPICYVIWCGMELEVMWIIMDYKKIQPLVCCFPIFSSIRIMVYLFIYACYSSLYSTELYGVTEPERKQPSHSLKYYLEV